MDKNPPASLAVAHRLEGLDALRGIAAICVLLHHAITIGAPPLALEVRGYLAVDFFFMLSGYVMARTYEKRLATGFSAARFLAARYCRLWPVMAIGTVISATLVTVHDPNPYLFLTVAVPNLLMVPVFSFISLYPLNTAAWSIFAELAVNLLHGLVLWRWRVAALALLAAIMLPVIVWIAMSFGSLDFGAGTDYWAIGIARALLAYTIGIVLWRRWQDSPELHLPHWLTFASMPVLVLVLPALGIGGWMFDVAFVALVCPLLIAGGLAYRRSHWLARWLGLISFPLYAVNVPLLEWSRSLGSFGALAGMACALVLAAFIARRTTPVPKREKRMAGA